MSFIDYTDGPHVYNIIINIIDHSHPSMRVGHPFKGRGAGRPFPGTLLTPDSIKFKIPIALAFVPINTTDEARAQHTASFSHHANHQVQSHKNAFLSAGNFKNSNECQKNVQNFNICLKNNDLATCQYYYNYLNNYCS